MTSNIERQHAALIQMLGYHLGREVSYPLIPPEHVYFSLTNRCNLRCSMCAIEKTPAEENELSVPEIKAIILQIKELGVKHLILSGGEPLLREDLTTIVEYACKNISGRIDIITNGTLFNSLLIENLLKARLNHITFSIDGLKKTNDEIRGIGSFDKAINNIKKLNDYKVKKGLLFPTLGINFTVMNNNINQILPMIEFARAIGCNCIIFQSLLSNNIKMFEKNENDLWPSELSLIELEKIIPQVLNLKEALTDFEICTDKAVLDSMPDYFKRITLQGKFKCYEAIKRIVVGYDGKVWSCAGVYGDLRIKSLKEIWFSEDAERIRNTVRQCSEHCLQDCVHVSSEIFLELKMFLKKIEFMQVQEKDDIRKFLLEQLSYFENILSNGPPFSLRPFRPADVKQGMGELNSIKEAINNNGRASN